MRLGILGYIFCGTLCVLAGCGTHKASSVDNVNPELIGSWNNDSGCSAIFIKHNGKLVLQNFSNSHSAKFDNINLVSYKESIFSKFKAEDSTIQFKGMFTEGVIIIDNYCKEALHKVDGSQPPAK